MLAVPRIGAAHDKEQASEEASRLDKFAGRESARNDLPGIAVFRQWGISLPPGGSLPMECEDRQVYTAVQLADRGPSQAQSSACGSHCPHPSQCHVPGLIGSIAERSLPRPANCIFPSYSYEGEHPGIRMCGHRARRSKFRGLFRPYPTDNSSVSQSNIHGLVVCHGKPKYRTTNTAHI